ncbi:MAG: hypothetical protein E4H41_07240 [Gemmatimonadales bacterium]|jgi:hypothetical protein|nr:MAG: hypothetical protein E4H41_07240 [Gemmatimonadales bacterium]
MIDQLCTAHEADGAPLVPLRLEMAMKRRARHLAALAAVLSAGCSGAPRQELAPDAEALVGVWRVDLRPTPDAEPYYQEFIVEGVEGDTIRGTFYGTPIEHGRINTDWGQVRFAFTTADGSGPYNTSGVLSGTRVQGTTHSLGRRFLAVWSAERTP